MEFTISSAVLSLALVAGLTCIWQILNWAYLEPKKLEKCLKEQGYKGNPFKLYGDKKDMIEAIRGVLSKPMDASFDDIAPYIQPYHHHCRNLHGDNCYMWMGQTPRIIVSDPKLIKEILFNYDAFRKVQKGPLVKTLLPGLLGYEGMEWVMHRRLMNPSFNLDKLKHMVPAMYLSCVELIDEWDTLLSLKGSCELDVWPFLSNFSADIISRAAFGSSYKEGKVIFQLQKEQVHLVIQCMHSFYRPVLSYFPTKTNRRLRTIHNEMGALIRDIIDKKEKGMNTWGPPDLLEILLRTISEENTQIEGKKTNLKLSIEQIIEECKLFHLAGQETISVLLVWTMVLLSRHQKWQTLAREEVFAVFGNNEPDFDGLNRLKTVTMILYEVLRLYPPVPITARRTNKKIKLGETILPPGVDVELSFISVLNDPHIWGEDAKQFNPGRFSEGITKAAKVQGTFLSFSTGPRICIGQNLAMVEAKLALVTILRSFSFTLSPSYKHAPSYVLSIEPQRGARLILQKI